MRRWLVLMACLGIAVAGCGGEEEPEDLQLTGKYDGGEVTVDGEGTVVATDTKTGERVTVKTKGDEVTVKGEGGRQPFTATATDDSVKIQTPDNTAIYGGLNTKLPKDMPEDVPTHSSMKILSVVSDKETGTLLYQAEIGGDIGTVISHYEREALDAGWSQTNKQQQIGMQVMNFKKDDRALIVMALPVNNGTQVNVTMRPKK